MSETNRQGVIWIFTLQLNFVFPAKIDKLKKKKG